MRNFIVFTFLVYYSINLSSQDIKVKTDGSLEVSGEVIRKVQYATGNDTGFGIDIGQVPNRVLTYNKKHSDTKLRISYTDNFRVVGPNKACRWTMRIDGSACPSQDLGYNIFVSEGNSHQNKTMVGYCDQVPAGEIEVQIWVGPAPGYTGCDCFTGWGNQVWLIEVERYINSFPPYIKYQLSE